MRHISKIFGGLLLLVWAELSFAIPVTFDFDFKDANGVSFGTGFYTFDDIAPGTKASFNSLSGFSWGFDVPSLGLSLSSAAGDVPSTDSLTAEGILLAGSAGSRTLTFFDDDATYILHRDISRLFPTGIEFSDVFTDSAVYFDESGVRSRGYFIATERSSSVSEPVTLALMGLGLAGLGYSRRRTH